MHFLSMSICHQIFCDLEQPAANVSAGEFPFRDSHPEFLQNVFEVRILNPTAQKRPQPRFVFGPELREIESGCRRSLAHANDDASNDSVGQGFDQ